MPNIRDMYWEAHQKAQKEKNEIIQAFKEVHGNIDDNEAVVLNIDDDFAPVMHLQLFLDKKLIAAIQNLLIKKSWRYEVTSNGSVFTSDNPILLKPHLKDPIVF